MFGTMGHFCTPLAPSPFYPLPPPFIPLVRRTLWRPPKPNINKFCEWNNCRVSKPYRFHKKAFLACRRRLTVFLLSRWHIFFFLFVNCWYANKSTRWIVPRIIFYFPFVCLPSSCEKKSLINLGKLYHINRVYS